MSQSNDIQSHNAGQARAPNHRRSSYTAQGWTPPWPRLTRWVDRWVPQHGFLRIITYACPFIGVIRLWWWWYDGYSIAMMMKPRMMIDRNAIWVFHGISMNLISKPEVWWYQIGVSRSYACLQQQWLNIKETTRFAADGQSLVESWLMVDYWLVSVWLMADKWSSNSWLMVDGQSVLDWCLMAKQ